MANERWRAEPNELPRLALSLATLALVGFSLVLACQMGALSNALRTEFAQRNTLGESGRLILLLSLGAGLALPALGGLWVLRRKRLHSALELLELLASLSAPLAVAFIVPGLFLSQLAQDKPLFYLVVLATFGLSLSALLAGSLARAASLPRGAAGRRFEALRFRLVSASLPRGVPLGLLLVCAAAYAFVLGRYAIAHHRLIQTMTADVGVADNVMANLLRSRHFRAPAYFGTAPGNYLTAHAEYGALLFLPFYAVRPGVDTLLYLQAGIAALAVLPLYLLTARKLGRGAAFVVSAAYLLFAPQHGALISGFSWLPAVTLFAFTAYYAIDTERRVLAWVSLAALLSISEAGPLNALGLGLMLLASRKSARWGLALVLLAVPCSGFNLWLSTHGTGALENPPLATAVASFYKNPVYFCWDLARHTKVTSIMHALAPLCLLPVLELSAWPLLIPGLLFTAAASVFWPNSADGQIASVVWVPGTFIALSFALERRLARGPSRVGLAAAVIALGVTMLSHSYDFGAFLRGEGFGGVQASLVRPNPQGQKRYDGLHQLLLRIPASASVAATTYLVPHVSARPDVFDTARPYGHPEYFLLSSREVPYVRDSLVRSFALHQYRLVATTYGEFYLFARGAETPETTDALTRLGLITP